MPEAAYRVNLYLLAHRAQEIRGAVTTLIGIGRLPREQHLDFAR